ncbi:MAG: radical SAM protein [Clostridia bacterium]|nr:radical SAM protein [Clostridia bacterium]
MSVFELGPIRPPSEANSLLLRVTRNCPWNRCKFCMLYKTDKFSPRSVEEIKADIDIMYDFKTMITESSQDNLNKRYSQLKEDEQHGFIMIYQWLKSADKSVFLQDANSIVLKHEKLVEVLNYLEQKFPEINRITTYARADTLSKLSLDQLRLLKEAGLTRIHSGYESGSDEVLKLINKGITKQQEIDAGIKVKHADIELSIYMMPGLGGRRWTAENALETADVVNQINPDFVRMRTFVIKKDSEIWYNTLNQEFDECTDFEKVQEIKLFLENLNGIDTMIKSDHIVNLLEGIQGHATRDKAKMLDVIEAFENLPVEDRQFFQLARRIAVVRNPEDITHLSEEQKLKIRETLKSMKTEEEFEGLLKELLRRYI